MTLDSVLLVVCAVAGQVHTMWAASNSMSASTGGCWLCHVSSCVCASHKHGPALVTKLITCRNLMVRRASEHFLRWPGTMTQWGCGVS